MLESHVSVILSLSQAEQLIKLKQIRFCQPKTHSLTNRSKLLVIGCLDAAEMKYKKIFYTNFGHIFEVPPILTLQGQCLQKWASQNRLFDDLTFLLENPFYSINAIKRTRQHAGEKYCKAEYVQGRACFVNEQVP